MNILKTKDKVLAALGNMRAMQRLHVDTYTEERIKNVSGIKIAESKEGQFWVSFQELNGYLFMNCTLLTRVDLKTSKGAKIILFTEDYEIEFESDEKVIESDFSNVSNTWITKMSFEIEEKEKQIIENINFEELIYKFKNGDLKLHGITETKNT